MVKNVNFSSKLFYRGVDKINMTHKSHKSSQLDVTFLCKKKDWHTALLVYMLNLRGIRNTELLRVIQSEEFHPLMTK